MVKPKSFDFVLKSLRDRKKFEKESAKKVLEAKCSHCKGDIDSNGISKIHGVCNNCISLSLKNIS